MLSHNFLKYEYEAAFTLTKNSKGQNFVFTLLLFELYSFTNYPSFRRVCTVTQSGADPGAAIGAIAP